MENYGHLRYIISGEERLSETILVKYSREILEENLYRLLKIYAVSLKMLKNNLEELPGNLKMRQES